MIRQAISCDICGSEKKQTNHWFVAYEQGGELRIGGWTSKNRLRSGAHHLCGQTCLHKLVDEFMARTLSSRPVSAAAEASVEELSLATTDTSLTSSALEDIELESSARLIPTPQPVPVAKPALRPVSSPPKRTSLSVPVELISPVARLVAEESIRPIEEVPRPSNARSWRAEAWEREREREMHTVERCPEIAKRRRASR